MPISGNAAATAKIAASPSSATAVHRAAKSTSAVRVAGRRPAAAGLDQWAICFFEAVFMSSRRFLAIR